MRWASVRECHQKGKLDRLEDPALELGQLRAGRSVRFARLRPGDLLFTEGGGHVQLVVSKRAAVSAPQTGARVRYVPLAQLRPEFAAARRVLH
jgi:peptidoglycan DL-endopeptidase CwlO